MNGYKQGKKKTKKLIKDRLSSPLSSLSPTGQKEKRESKNRDRLKKKKEGK